MANPPITIGPFTNVPAPGSPIRSDWPQQITNYVLETRNGFTWQTSFDGGPAQQGARLVQSRIIVVTTNASGDATIGFPFPFTDTAYAIVLSNVEPSLPHVQTIRTRNTTGIVINVRTLAGGGIVASASTAVSVLAIGRF